MSTEQYRICATNWSGESLVVQKVSFRSLIKLVFVMVAIIRQMVAGTKLGCTVNFFSKKKKTQLEGVSFTGNGDLTTSARVKFSRVPRGSSLCLCVTKQSSSHLARTKSDFLPDHLPNLRCCPLHMERYPARILRMCLSATWLNRTRQQMRSLCAQPCWSVNF